jgi:PHD/YefM family antitoxin component YafN of YafNO toxin-antitoxin module
MRVTADLEANARHGKPVAVLLSEQAYAALQGQQQRSNSPP